MERHQKLDFSDELLEELAVCPLFWVWSVLFFAREMFTAAARALSACSPARSAPTASLSPMVEDVRDVSQRVAVAVGLAAQRAGVAEPTSPEEVERRVRAQMWTPRYPRLKYKA